MRAFPLSSSPTPSVLSVDDFALRGGRTYGTILVDLEQHRVVDLLSDRCAATFASWLRDHPGTRIISRDRGGEYAEGARRGAPEAVQVADRFHLLRNAGDVTRRVLRRHAALIQRLPAPGAPALGLTRRRLDRAATKERTKDTMRERFEQIHALAAEGLTKNAIARRLGVNRKTVYRYLALAAPPERRHTWCKGSAIGPYEGYIVRRFEQGCRNGRAVWRELVAQGYPGAYNNVARIMGYLRHEERRHDRAPPAPTGLTVQQAVGVLLMHHADRSDEEQRTVEQLKTLDPEVVQAITLLESFLELVRASPLAGALNRLDRWMAEAVSSGLPEFLTFVVKLRQDRDAVLAGLSLSWSQGQTEGQITKLKLLKRGMYGRAKFDLLRQRVLYNTAA
jgi:transposase